MIEGGELETWTARVVPRFRGDELVQTDSECEHMPVLAEFLQRLIDRVIEKLGEDHPRPEPPHLEVVR